MYDNGLVIEAGGPLLEMLDAATGARLYSYATGNTIYSAPSVANGQVFVGSTDGNVYAFGLSTTPPPTPIPDPSCPAGWSCQDIGNSTPAGSENVSGGTWSVQAGGSGVGGASDQFRFIAQNVNGDTQISAQVVSQQATTGPAQAGLMVRQSGDPTSPYYSVFLSKGVGVVVQYRPTFGGGTNTDVQMPTAVPPLYLEIQHIGDQFQAATSNDGTNYTLVPGSTVSVLMTTPVEEGLAVSSDNTSALSTATYSTVARGPHAHPLALRRGRAGATGCGGSPARLPGGLRGAGRAGAPCLAGARPPASAGGCPLRTGRRWQCESTYPLANEYEQLGQSRRDAAPEHGSRFTLLRGPGNTGQWHRCAVPDEPGSQCRTKGQYRRYGPDLP